ncbi:MAG: hypothetical protein K9J77_04475, partial [Rhodoferax sp.]|nr:hypothetical protein [Rhodoferax sp.]
MNAIAASVGRIHLRSTTREWLVFAAFFLLFGSYQVYFFHNRHVRVDQRERDRLSDQCSMVSTNMARQFSSINAVLAGLVKEVPAWRAQSGGYTLAAQHLMALNNAMPGVLTFLVFDANGTVLASDKPELVGQNFAERDYFQAVQKNPNPDTLYVRPPFTSKLGNFTMNLVRMV